MAGDRGSRSIFQKRGQRGGPSSCGRCWHRNSNPGGSSASGRVSKNTWHGFLPTADLVRSAFSEDAATLTTEPPTSPAAEAVTDGDPVVALAPFGSPTDTARLLGKWIWAWPLVAALILGIAGFWARSTVERVMRDQMASKLLALRDADVKALDVSFEAHRAIASIAANEPRVLESVRILLARGERDTASLLRVAGAGRAAGGTRSLARAVRIRRLPHPRSAGA